MRKTAALMTFGVLFFTLSLSATELGKVPSSAGGEVSAAAAGAVLAAPVPSLDTLLGAVNRSLVDQSCRQEDLAPEDIMVIGAGQKAESMVVRNNDSHSMLKIPLPTVGKLAGVFDGNYRIDYETSEGFASITMPKELAISYRPGGERAVRRALGELKAFQPVFAPGEKVRFRGKYSGLMKTGTYIGPMGPKKGSHIRVAAVSGEETTLPKWIYKWTGQSGVYSPHFEVESGVLWPEWKLNDRLSVLSSFLHGAARVSSHPDFLAASVSERFRQLVRYTRSVVLWHEAATFAEIHGLRTFNHILTAGIGVCRHQATLLAGALIEAGYDARPVYYYAAPARFGHAWVEIGRDSAGEPEYVADPTNNQVWSWNEIQKMARQSADTLAAAYFAQPGRKAAKVAVSM